MHPDIQKAINLIDRKITGLQRAKQALLDEFEDGNTSTDQNKMSARSVSSHHPGKPKTTQKMRLIKLLQAESPLTRVEIVEKSGIPKGTIASLLNDKETFEGQDGKWQLKVKNRMFLPSQSEGLSSAFKAETP